MDNKKFIRIVSILGKLIEGSQFFEKTYIVGGAVRDYILHKDIKDIDIVVELPNGGIELGKYLTDKYSSSKIVIYETYGTCKFTLDGIEELKDIDFEAVQTRKEWYSEGSRKPSSVAVGTIYDDALRRDLTINALYMNVNTLSILDPTHKGKDDIADELIRIPSTDANKTFTDDPLRMLRVVRFYGKLGWKISKDTFRGILNNSKKINTISKERIAEELNKLLLLNKPSDAFMMLRYTCLLDKILPDIYKLKDFHMKFSFGDNVYENTMNVVDNSSKILINRLAALFHEVGKVNVFHKNSIGTISYPNFENESSKMARQLLTNLKYSNLIINKVCFAIENQLKLDLYGYRCENMSNKSVRKLLNLFGNEIDLITDLINAINTSASIYYVRPYIVKGFRYKINQLMAKGEDISGNIKLPINGNDIMKLLNIKSGPNIKLYLDYVKELYLENPAITKEECEIKIKEKYNKILQMN